MKAIKLIINGEEQALSQVYSVNWQTGDVRIDTGATVKSTAPSSPVKWMLWYDTTNSVLKVYNGSTWQTI